MSLAYLMSGGVSREVVLKYLFQDMDDAHFRLIAPNDSVGYTKNTTGAKSVLWFEQDDLCPRKSKRSGNLY